MPKLKPKLKQTAMRLHDRGLWVVPCNGKGAIWKDWPTRRRTREELAAVLDNNSALNISLVLNQSDWIDVECDSPEAESNFQRLCGDNVPPTPTWQSKRGLHRLFLRPEGLPQRAKLDIDDIEFHIGNGKGANAIIPPSVHPSGIRYKWIPGLSLDDLEPAPLPQCVVERLLEPTAAPTEPSATDTISKGKRNEALFGKAVALRGCDLPEETMAETLLDLNRRICDPPLPESEVREIAHSAATGDKAKIGWVNRLLGDIELWHDDNDDPFGTLPQGDHRENWLIGKRSRPCRRWLSKLHYDFTGKTISASDLADICAMLEGKAVFDGQRHRLWRRVAEHDGKFYLDLCDEGWRAVEIDAKGWRIVSDPPVKFRRAKAMHPLPIPAFSPGTELWELLRPFLNICEMQWPLVGAWLAAALRPSGPYPLLKFLGEQGSAKTTAARVLRALVDPNAAPVRAEPRSTRDLVIAANNGWQLVLDNLSNVKPDLSDALCRLSTGGGFATRELYTDQDEVIFDAQRPVILTSIEEVGTRSDLLERSLIIELPNISESNRRAEKTFWRDFEKVRPRILGALIDVVSGAIHRLPEIEKRTETELPRLADFYTWGLAAEAGLGLEPGTFAEAFRANQEAATRTVLESCPLVAALLGYLRLKSKLEGAAAELLAVLGNVDSELVRQPGWPKSPRVLSAILKRVAPNLRQVGIVAVQDTRGGGNKKEKIWRIEDRNERPKQDNPKSKLELHLRKKKRGSQNRKGRKNSKTI